MVTLVIGHDVRTWTHYEVKDATPEEIEILSGEDDAALELARKLDAEERLVEVDEHSDDAHDPLGEFSHPAVVDVQEEEL
jgi:hypothetical protein